MKVLLVNPPAKRMVRSILPAEVEAERGLFPPLGVLYLAASLRGLADVTVHVIDAQAEGLAADDVALRVIEHEYDVVGVTALTFTLVDAMDVALAVKAARPGTVVIAGGPHSHIFPEATLGLGPFDAVCRGEGELSLRSLIAGWPGTRDDPPPGIWWRGGKKGEPDAAPVIEALDGLPFPARRLSRVELYHSVLSGLRPITTMMSSRGCPFGCVFCDRPHLGKRFRPRSATNVVDEMEEAAGLGIKEIVFYDDTFTVDRERVRQIAELILTRGLRVAWDVRARVSDLEADDYKLCRRAGMTRVHFGVESGDPELLKSLRKGITIGQAREAFKWAREAGLETLAYFMAGLPGETGETMQRTLELAIELSPDYAHFSVLIPFPGTPVYQTGLDRGIIRSDVWSEFAAAPRPEFTPPVWEENLNKAEILAGLARMYRRFYRQPRVLARRIKRAGSVAGLARGARLGLRILFMRSGRP
ncbi:MAG TPA: radical SAM protein [bacterium]|nr:radical SAM protein [bacterium]